MAARLASHPRRAVVGRLPPGPRLPGPAQAILWGLHYPQFTQRAHARHGSTFTVRPGTMGTFVVTRDRDAARRLLTGDPLGKAAVNDVVRPLLAEPSLFLLGPREHLARRKLLLPPFHGERVRRYGALMRELMETEVDSWRPGDTVAVLSRAQDVTIEVILRAVLGVADPRERRAFRRVIDDILFYPLGALRLRAARRLPLLPLPRRLRAGAAFLASLPTPAVLTYFPQTKTRSAPNFPAAGWFRHHDRLLAMLDAHIAHTRADPRLQQREDVLAMLVQARDEDGRGLSDEALRYDLVGLIGAGHETTAAAIAWGAVLLAHHPEAAHAPVDALVKETLRFRPPVPVAAVRALEEPFAVDGHTVPAGIPVILDAWGLHHDPASWGDPERFRPGRWADESPEPYSWLPFGGGAHRCLGAALAELELGIALETIRARVTLDPAEAELPPPARRGIVMVPHGGGRVRVADRVG